jgi:IS5 family transposase
MHRGSGQLGFADLATERARSGRRDRLVEIARLLNWAELERLVEPIYAAPTGRPSYPQGVMLRVLLLQAWHCLSDPGMEEALADRDSFRRFAGFSWEETTPDHSTIWRFREQLALTGLAERLFAEVNRQLAAHGFILKIGTLIDATLIPSAAAEPAKQPGGGSSAADPQARWTKRGNRATYGYKAHVAVDQGSGLVRRIEVTPANVNDCVLGPALVQGDEAAVYADQAYDSATMRARLAASRAANQVMRRPNKHHRELPPQDKARNASIARVRGRVEGFFGTLKRSYRWTRMRYFNLARNQAGLLLAGMAMNLRRALVLAP